MASVSTVFAVIFILSKETSPFAPPFCRPPSITNPSPTTRTIDALDHQHARLSSSELFHAPTHDERNVEVPIEVKTALKEKFGKLLSEVAASMSDKSEDIPSLLAQNIETIIQVLSIQDLMEETIAEDVANRTSTSDESCVETSQERLERLSEAANVIITFVEAFVDETKSMDNVYKEILGTIFRSISPPQTESKDSDKKQSAAKVAMEEQLDKLLASSKEAFTPGFLRHVEGECERLSNVKESTQETVRMLSLMRLIQTRVLEELGKGLGDGAVVLGQLLGYESEAERLAVLDAGLAVRGVAFARELSDLTCEALDGFEAVKIEGGQVDSGLVKMVKSISDRIQHFLDIGGVFQ